MTKTHDIFVVVVGNCHEIHHWCQIIIKCHKLSTISLSQSVWNISMWLVCLADDELQLRRCGGCHGEVVMVTTLMLVPFHVGN